MDLKILVIDDSATARALLKACMPKDIQVEIYEADNYDDAIEKASAHHPTICIVDYNMPEKTGIEIAKAIQDKGIKTQFILMTASTQQAVVQQAKALGFVAILEKPISRELIEKTLSQLK